ncbi:hypothetical protein [Polaribacter filamentus]|uniref:hypothetical protein n=1 Tax=Polaribacter filamentus TaxID=53483 RepID=UPI00269E1267
MATLASIALASNQVWIQFKEIAIKICFLELSQIVNLAFMKLLKKLFFLAILFLVSACATMKLQVAENQFFEPKESTAEIEYTFYLIGDAGNSTLKKIHLL